MHSTGLNYLTAISISLINIKNLIEAKNKKLAEKHLQYIY